MYSFANGVENRWWREWMRRRGGKRSEEEEAERLSERWRWEWRKRRWREGLEEGWEASEWRDWMRGGARSRGGRGIGLLEKRVTRELRRNWKMKIFFEIDFNTLNFLEIISLIR
ncbi:hypothetical protein ACH5RR_010773 [Cinchona calisaya]|uniref:Uncharacterized protein n=1 Tax=Cinchona calisaya TaxID=153742 RepID=A0ABD3AJU5_9GENT